MKTSSEEKTSGADAQRVHGDKEYLPVTFLNALFKNCHGGSVNLRFSPSGENLIIPLGEISSLGPILEIHGGENAYFIPTAEGGNGKKKAILEVPALWVNLDFKSMVPDEKERARERYANFRIKGSFVILTGGEVLVFWLLRQPVPAQRIHEAEDLLKRLASHFCDKPGLTGIDQALRIPGTLNHEYSPPKEVFLDVSIPGNQYDLNDFVSLLGTEAGKAKDNGGDGAAPEEIPPEVQGHTPPTGEGNPGGGSGARAGQEPPSVSPRVEPDEPIPTDSPSLPSLSEPFSDGWVKLYRKILENPVFKNPEALQLLLYCLLRANYQPTKILFNKREVSLERGQFIFGLEQACRDLDMSIRKLRHRLILLQNIGILSRKTSNRFSIITVCNYNLYQDSENGKGQAKRQSEVKQRSTDKKDNKEKKSENIECNDFERLTAFLSSLPEYEDFTPEARDLISEFINRVRASNKTETIQGGRVRELVGMFKGIIERSDEESLLLGLKRAFKKMERDGFDFKKRDPTGYVWSVAKSEKARKLQEESLRAGQAEKRALRTTPEGKAFQDLKGLIKVPS